MFFPQFTQPQQFVELYRKMVSDHLTRLEGLSAQLESVETKSYERAAEAIEETSKLMKASFDYSQELASAWRKQALEVAKQAASAVTPLG